MIRRRIKRRKCSGINEMVTGKISGISGIEDVAEDAAEDFTEAAADPDADRSVRPAPAEEGESLTMGLPELLEYNKGVDERDDYDVEKIVKPPKTKKKKKHK